MSDKPRQFKVRKITPAYGVLPLTTRQLNPMNPETILELQEVVSGIESDPELSVVVFDSAHPTSSSRGTILWAESANEGVCAQNRVILGVLQIPVEGKQ